LTTAKETRDGLANVWIARYMLPLASSAKPVARDAERQTENAMAVPDGLNFVTKEQALFVEGVPRLVEVSGKSGDEVVRQHKRNPWNPPPSRHVSAYDPPR